jgi:predicted RNase H-like nuclease
MMVVNQQRDAIIFGFDSGWTDNAKAPGAICAVAFDGDGQLRFHEPRPVSFAEARSFIHARRNDFGTSLMALDQPSVVPNVEGMRPVGKVAAWVVSWIGGGVQPANRSKAQMFGDHAPI